MASVQKTYTITDTSSATFREVHPGFTGRWFFQVTAYSGLTSITPQMSVDGTTWVTRAITPYSNAADVTTITATGGWMVDSGSCQFSLIGVGTGSATVVVQPAIG